jgi:hypothetical protein
MDERLKAIKDEYGLEATDMWQLPQNKQWLIKHAALEVVAAKAGIVFDMPEVIERDSAAGIAVICVTGKWKDRVEWSFGEASPKNSKTGYPWAICEKRAKDRVILKLIGIHGLVYSEDEMSDADERPARAAAAPATKVLVKDQRDIDKDLRAEIDACATVEELERLWRSALFKTELAKLKPDWHEAMITHASEHKALLTASPARVPPNFEAIEGGAQ